MTNITIGQYYPADSNIHSLDPRVKLVSMIVYATMLFLVNNVYGYLLSFVGLAVVVMMSTVPIKLLIKGLRVIIFIFVFTGVLNVLFTDGSHVLFRFGAVKISVEGILTAVKVAIRLTMLIVAASLLTLTTSPVKLTGAIEYGLKPFARFGAPSHEIAMMTTIALRFIPTLLEETQKIMKAQIARGADFDTGGVVKRAKGYVPLLVPLFVSAFRRADELAVAMEARCYNGGTGRTRMKELKLSRDDVTAIVIMAAFVAFIVALNLLPNPLGFYR